MFSIILDWSLIFLLRAGFEAHGKSIGGGLYAILDFLEIVRVIFDVEFDHRGAPFIEYFYLFSFFHVNINFIFLTTTLQIMASVNNLILSRILCF